MNAQELLDAGYVKFQDYFAPEHMRPQYAYQKKIRSDEGKLLYFINVYEYDWREFNKHPHLSDYIYRVKLSLYVDEKADCINIEFNCTNYDVDELEHYVLTGLYRRLYCVPDKLND